MSEPLEILYQDAWFVAINKPAGHLVHPAEKPQEDDLVAMKILRDQIGHRVYTIHRLDRPTCGILVFGIDPECSRALHKAFELYETEKMYHAVVDGHPVKDRWLCEEAIQKEEGKPWREAKTEFELLAKFTVQGEKMSLIRCRPHTGRFHQIRRHLLSAGYPIVGDYRYAGIERSDFLTDLLQTDQRMMVQARTLELTHPISQKQIVMSIKDQTMFSEAYWQK